MACSREFLTKKLEEIKISDDIFLGNDLSYEGKFLNSVIEKMLQEIKDCEVFFTCTEDLWVFAAKPQLWLTVLPESY